MRKVKLTSVVVILLCLLASEAPADSILEKARQKMLQCSFESAKSELVKRAKDKVYQRTRKRENIEDKLIRDNLVCALETVESVLTYKRLFQ